MQTGDNTVYTILFPSYHLISTQDGTGASEDFSLQSGTAHLP